MHLLIPFIERYFGLDDKPLRFYQQLKQAGESPMFVMRPNKQTQRSNTIKPPTTNTVVPSRQASLMNAEVRTTSSTSTSTTTTATTISVPPRQDSRRLEEPLSSSNSLRRHPHTGNGISTGIGSTAPSLTAGPSNSGSGRLLDEIMTQLNRRDVT
jgi:hypothetical protein